MTRPHKHRMVSSNPEVLIYKPVGVPARMLEWVTLTLDEYEAIRLIDCEGQDQETVAESMGVSRPTVTRIYASARSKIASVLVKGQALRIEGGPVLNIGSGQSCGCGGRREHSCRHGQGRNGNNTQTTEDSGELSCQD